MIHIVNARDNNLKGVTLTIPNNKLIAVTGVSGSGKSTLVNQVIFQEARRRYLESFSANTRQLLGKAEQAHFDYISGLSPAIALEQKQKLTSARSTVGTLTELYDLLRLLFARYGTAPKGAEIDSINRNLFSFNSPHGACSICNGLGVADAIDKDSLITDASKSLREGVIKTTTTNGYIMYSQVTVDVLNEVCKAEGFSVNIPWQDLSEEHKNVVWYGSKKTKVPFGKHTLESRMKWKGITAKPREEGYYKGMVPIMDEILKRDRNPSILRFTKTIECPTCKGKRLNEQALSVLYNDYSIDDIASLEIEALYSLMPVFIQKAKSDGEQVILEEIRKTTQLITLLGLGFLSLTRSSASLSGGETQRLRLAKLVNSGLRGMLYVFDEPSIGMHNTEVKSLLSVLYKLRDAGNTVIIVEHNNMVIQNCEWIIDIGPMAGKNGGEILFNGSIDEFIRKKPKQSKTIEYFEGKGPLKANIRGNKQQIKIKEVNTKHLKNLSFELAFKGINVLTGKSGVGKTSLIKNVLGNYFSDALNNNKENNNNFKSISGHESIKKLVVIDQSPIGKTPRSNPSTYTGLSDELRNLFAALPESKAKGLTKSHFSFNTKNGRCPKCEGAGYLQIGMHTLGLLESICDVCLGKQFQAKVLEVKYRDKTLADIYAMDADEAYTFFQEEKKIHRFIEVMRNLGIGYLKLNQRSSTLSGGEARRIKLAKDLAKGKSQPTLYLIDEPSTGLHGYDVEVLIKSLQKLIEQGHTIVLSERNELFLQNAQRIIELGKNAQGNNTVLFQGSYESYSSQIQKQNSVVDDSPTSYQVQNINSPIRFEQVSTHNLKHIDVEFPSNKLTVVTGVSGSGKSSLIFDTLFAEGRQRFAESFSTYVRSRLNLNSEAQYESVSGLYPTIAIDQNNYAKSERSTVGTMTDIYAQLRLLFSRVGKSENNVADVLSSQFSFNHEHGACPHCEGLGFLMQIDEDKLLSQPHLSIADGAMHSCKPAIFYSDIYGQYYATLRKVAEQNNINLSKPWSEFSEKEKDLILHGTGKIEYEVNWLYKRKDREGTHNFKGKWPGFLFHLEEEYLRKINDKRADAFEPILKQQECENCMGRRLNNYALSFTVAEKNIIELSEMSITELTQFFRELLQNAGLIDKDILKQKAAFIMIGAVMRGLDVLEKLGLGYLSLSRKAKTLSGGEGQRVRLASSLVHDLSGVCFVLDEPTLGLHPKDTQHLLVLIKDLVGQGNTVVVSEHDPYFVKNADHVIEIGPKAGNEGGQLIAEGSFEEILENKESLSSKYFADSFTFNRKPRKVNFDSAIEIVKANANNLKNISLKIPCASLVGIKGVSGSGKSSLVRNVIYDSFRLAKPVNCKQIKGLENFDQVIWVNQNSLKAGGQSYVASALNFYDKLKQPFIKLEQAKKLTLSAKHFSLNGKNGCCEECNGKGYKTTALDFLSNVDEPCEACGGQRFNKAVLSCKWKNKTIAEIMELPIKDLTDYYDEKWMHRFSLLAEQIGIGYISAGQLLKTLSGGELQRIKLLQSILESKANNILFLFDEPTMGLHLSDVEKLLAAFNALVSDGHSIIFIEHNSHLLNCADYTIELGPGAGEKGGSLIVRKDA